MKISKKLKSKHGETLVEVICAFLVITICCAFLFSVVVKAKIINKKVVVTNQPFTYDKLSSSFNVNMAVSNVSMSGIASDKTSPSDVISSDASVSMSYIAADKTTEEERNAAPYYEKYGFSTDYKFYTYESK